MKTVQTAINPDTYNTIQENIMKGKFPMRSMRDQYKSVLNMGSLSSVVSMIPGMNSNVMSKDQEKFAIGRIKKFLCMMDSMTEDELDSGKTLDNK